MFKPPQEHTDLARPLLWHCLSTQAQQHQAPSAPARAWGDWSQMWGQGPKECWLPSPTCLWQVWRGGIGVRGDCACSLVQFLSGTHTHMITIHCNECCQVWHTHTYTHTHMVTIHCKEYCQVWHTNQPHCCYQHFKGQDMCHHCLWACNAFANMGLKKLSVLANSILPHLFLIYLSL